MKSKKNNETNVQEASLIYDVDKELIQHVRKGEITSLVVELTEDNQNLIIENVDGQLILVIDELPDKYHGCYLYNNGVFPYAIKDTLQFIVLHAGDDICTTKIINVETEPGVRFRFQGPGEPSIEDPNGDSCIWKITCEVVPLQEEPRMILMRWNPAISSFKEKDYKECVEHMTCGGFRLNWSIFDWEDARRGDKFCMLRVGDKKAGIVFDGIILSDPYVADDWAGTQKRKHYVDLFCTNPVEPGKKPALSIDKLQKGMPLMDWETGPSGVILKDYLFE